MTNIEQQITNVSDFIERYHSKDKFTEGVFWALMRNAAFNKNRTPKDTLATNNDTAELEESVSLLTDEIKSAHESGENIMHVRFYSDKKLTNLVGNRKIRIKEVKTADSGMFGMSNNSNIAGFLIQSHQNALGQIHEAKVDLINEKLNRKIEDLENELAYEKENKQTTIEKFGQSLAGFVETPEGIGKILETINTVSGLFQMFKKPSGALGNIPTAAPVGVQLSEDQQRWLQAYEQLEEVYEGNLFQLMAILIYHKTHFSSKFDGIVKRMATDCEKKRIELEKSN